jgi:hypothetical protein
MTIKLSTGGEYHINKEYPYKFVPADAAAIGFAGADHKQEGEKTATMTVRFKPAAAGDAKVEGTYKMSVCSAEQCQIEQPKISLTVPVI